MKSHRIFVYRGRPNFWLLSVKAFSSLCYLRTCTWLALVANHWNCNFLLIPNKPILEGIMLKLKLQYFGHLMRRVDSSEKTLVLGGIGGRRRRGRQRMRWLDGITDSMDVSLSELRVGDGQGGLACFDSWGRKESDTMEQLIWSDLILLEKYLAVCFRSTVYKELSHSLPHLSVTLCCFFQEFCEDNTSTTLF